MSAGFGEIPVALRPSYEVRGRWEPIWLPPLLPPPPPALEVVFGLPDAQKQAQG